MIGSKNCLFIKPKIYKIILMSYCKWKGKICNNLSIIMFQVILRYINLMLIPADSSFSEHFRQTIHFLINCVNKVKISCTVFRALQVNKFLTRVNTIKIISKNGKNSISIYILLSTLLLLVNVYFLIFWCKDRNVV